MLEASQADKNHESTSTQSQSTDRVAPHWDPKDLAGLDLVQDPVDGLADQAMDGIPTLVPALGAHLPQELGAQVHQVVGADLHQVEGAQLDQEQIHQLWATLKAGLQV